MKRLLKKSLYLTVAFCLVLSCTLISIFAAAPEIYSTEKNSGERDELCTTFNGTSALEYYTGKYTYENLSTLSESQLLTSLRTLMTDTHSKITSYDECRDLAPITDCENENGSIVTIYSSHPASVSDYNSGQGWNREHVWPQSLGGFGTSGGGADLHHIRPTESRINSTRGNNKYGEVSSGNDVTGNLSGESGGTYGNSIFEPLDNVKGDVARICLYVYVRWGGVSSYTCDDLTVVFTDIDTLLHWCEIDPVDTWEMGRNEVVESIQGNRNVFIDYPELAWLMLGEEVPENMSTPSGKANGGNNGSAESCDHNDTTLVDKKDVTCTENGYTGDIKCNNCKEIVTKGTVIYADGHIYGEVTVTKNPTETEAGESFKTCGTCGLKVTIVIPPTSASKLVEIVSNNVYYKDTLNLMYAVRATEGYDVAVKIYDADNNLVETITRHTTENVNGEILMAFTSLVGVPMQDIDTEFYAVAELSNEGSVVTISATKRYSVLEYLYERLYVSKNVTEAQKTMYKRLITYANSADIVLNNTSAENSIGNYSYVRVENGTVDGTYSTAIVKSGAALTGVTASDDIVGSGEPVSWKIVSYDFEKTPSTITAADASLRCLFTTVCSAVLPAANG